MLELRQTEVFSEWLEALRDRQAKGRILARLKRLSLGNPGDVQPVGEGISELRIHCGPGYRVYYKQDGLALVLLLCGGNKDLAVSGYRVGQGIGKAVEGVPRMKTRPFDVAEHLATGEDIVAYLEAVFEDGDPQLIAAAIGDVARAYGMARIAEEAGLSREGLYRSLSSEGNPQISTVIKVLRVLGVRLEAHAVPT